MVKLETAKEINPLVAVVVVVLVIGITIGMFAMRGRHSMPQGPYAPGSPLTSGPPVRNTAPMQQGGNQGQ